MTNDLETYLETLSPEIRDLALKTRALVQATLPELGEHVHLGWGSLIYGMTDGKMSGAVCYVAGHKRDVNLGFYKGATLPDPEGLLAGTGKHMRHVKIKQASDLERPALVELLRTASTLA